MASKTKAKSTEEVNQQPLEHEPIPELEHELMPEKEQREWGSPTIKVLGVGGGGCNAVNRMYKDRIPGVEYYGLNTDALHLSRCEMPNKIPMGQILTRGLGVGGDPELGRMAAEESHEQLANAVAGADLLFLAAGMGGGTGTGSCPLIAQLAKEAGALTVAVVSKPFSFEISQRRRNADDGIARLKEVVDTIIVIPNNQLLQLSERAEEGLTWDEALKMADSVLQQGIQAIAEVITVPGEINVDFADVKAILEGAGPAWLAIGTGTGEDRAIEAAKQAINSPLLDVTIEGVRRILFVVTGGPSMTLKELQDAADVIQEIADPEANIIFGTVRDPNMDEQLKVTLVAAAFPMPEEAGDPQEPMLPGLAIQPEVSVAPAEDEEELDVPSFLRRQSTSRGRGFFR